MRKEAMENEEIKKEDKVVNRPDFSPALRTGAIIIGTLAILAGIFWLGRASTGNYHSGWRNGDRFERGLNGYQMGPGMMRRSFDDDDIGSRRGMVGGSYYGSSISGTISAINGNNITVKDSNNKEYTVTISDTTSIIASDGSIAKQSDLKENNSVIVRGPSGSNGQINATVIRIK